MSRIAVLSDIHGNFEALDGFLDHGKNINACFCLGDIVGYGPWPSECIEVMQTLQESGPNNTFFVRGNHDDAVTGAMEPEWFNSNARAAVMWHRRMVPYKKKKWLAQHPQRLAINTKFGKAMFVHGGIVNPYDYLDREWEAKDAARVMIKKGYHILFCGHSHIPGIHVFDNTPEIADMYYLDENGIMRIAKVGSEAFRERLPLLRSFWKSYENIYREDQPIKIERDKICIVNVGSIGQPRDLDPRACYVVFDDEKMTIEYKRFKYDVAKTMKDVLDLGLPDNGALRLAEGR